MQDRGQLAGAGAQGPSPKHKAKEPCPSCRADIPVYLTLRALSSLDQDSVEGKEGRDEEEATSALLPIWKWREKQAWESIKPTTPPPTPQLTQAPQPSDSCGMGIPEEASACWKPLCT